MGLFGVKKKIYISLGAEEKPILFIKIWRLFKALQLFT
jgi:hypothetical protein